MQEAEGGEHDSKVYLESFLYNVLLYQLRFIILCRSPSRTLDAAPASGRLGRRFRSRYLNAVDVLFYVLEIPDGAHLEFIGGILITDNDRPGVHLETGKGP